MKTLIILRHGKAEGYNQEGDHQRVLTDRGVRDSREAGKWIAGLVKPDLVVSSAATRARQTAEFAAAAGEFGPVTLDPRIYAADAETLAEVVAGLPSEAGVVLLVGHNPGFEELAAGLSKDPLPMGSMPTSSSAVLRFNVDSWQDVAPSTGKLAGFFSPK